MNAKIASTDGTFTACQFLPWDSKFFSRRIARVNGRRLEPAMIDEIRAWCAENRIECLYFLADSSDSTTVLLAEDHGFRLTDVRVTLETTCGSTPVAVKRSATPTIRPASASDTKALRAIAHGSYSLSRFYFDPGFSTEECDAFYDTWIVNSCDGWADIVLVADLGDGPVGYVTCHLGDKGGATGWISLVGMHESERGRGTARTLVEHSVDWFRDQGMRNVEVVTQARNVAAQRLYQRCGFLTSSVELCYHKWFAEHGA